MKEILSTVDINTETVEGLTLFKALIMLSVEIYPNGCVEDILKRINKVQL